MDDFPAHILLRDALALLNDRPNFGLRRDPRATSYRLAARIDAYFASRQSGGVSWAARAAMLFGPSALRFDPPPAAAAGAWVPVWVQVPATGMRARVHAALDAATAALPPITREAYLAHRDRQLEYSAIAAELGISVAEVAKHIATALTRLDEAVTPLEGDEASERGDDANAR